MSLLRIGRSALAGLITLPLLCFSPMSHALPPGKFIGAPQFDKAKDHAAFIWNDKDGFHVRIRGTKKKKNFNGKVCTDKRVITMTPSGLEGKDEVRLDRKSRCITFRFSSNAKDMDGFDFRAGGKRLLFDVRADDLPFKSRYFHIGKDNAKPAAFPAVLER